MVETGRLRQPHNFTDSPQCRRNPSVNIIRPVFARLEQQPSTKAKVQQPRAVELLTLYH